jgi:hypothetical protein
MRTTLVLDAPRMALGLRAPGADVTLLHHSDAGSQPRLNRSDRPARPGVDRHRRRRPGQRAGGIVCGFLQARADRRPRVALARPGRTRDRQMGRLVQSRSATRVPRRHPPIVYEQLHAKDPVHLSVAATTASRVSTVGVNPAVDRLMSTENALSLPTGSAQAATTVLKTRAAPAGLSELREGDTPTHTHTKINKSTTQQPT